MRVVVAALTLAVLGGSQVAADSARVEKPIQLAQYMTCLKTGEETPPFSMTKICYYDCAGSRAAITIQSTQLCPLTIQR